MKVPASSSAYPTAEMPGGNGIAARTWPTRRMTSAAIPQPFKISLLALIAGSKERTTTIDASTFVIVTLLRAR